MSEVVTLSRFRADVARALNRRGKKLLESDTLAEDVAALEPLETYYIVKEIGVESAASILRATSTEQWQACVDIDCWQGDHFDPFELDAWLAPFAASGPTELAEAFLRLDEEVQIVFLAQSVDVYDTAEAEGLPEPKKGVERRKTPDAYFVVEPKPLPRHVEREVDPHTLVASIYQHDINEGFRILTAVKWEMASPIEEKAYRFRTGRMEDLGFPTRERAMALFSPPPKQPPEVPTLPVTDSPHLPALYAEPMTQESLLTRALGTIDDEAKLEGLESELRNVINAAVVAYGNPPKDFRQAIEVAERVRDTVSLGLEHLLSPDHPHPDLAAQGTAEQAATLLRTWPLRDIFRHGYACVVPVAKAAAKLVSDPVVDVWLHREHEDGPAVSENRLDQLFLKALARNPALHAGFDPANLRKEAAFGTKREIEDAEVRLKEIEERVA